MDLYTCGQTESTEIDVRFGLSLAIRGFSDAPPAALQAGLCYLKPFVPSEETEGSHGVAHEKPVDVLLHQVVEGLQGGDGGQVAQGWAVPN